MKKHSILVVLILSTLSSCTLIGHAVFKINIHPKWKTTKQLEKDFLKHNIPLNQAFILDTASLYNSINIFYEEKIATTTDSLKLLNYKISNKNDTQLVQIRYFDKNGNAIFKMINCFLELKKEYPWNVENCFDQFPPKEIEELKLDEKLNLDFFLPHINNFEGETLTQKNLPKSDYYALVFINEIMYGPTKDLIKQLYTYQSKFSNKNVKYIFVNNHNASIWNMLEPKMRAKVKEQF